MAKLLIIIASGVLEKDKALAGMMLARNLKARGIVEDVRVIFFGRSENPLAAGGPDLLEQYRLMDDAGMVSTACIAVADKNWVSSSLKSSGMMLEPVSVPIARYVSEGYQISTF